MKTALVTITYGKTYEEMSKITHPTLKAYADKIGAEFIVWKYIDGHKLAGYKKLDIGIMLNVYERVIFVDTDIIIREDSPNLFDIVPYDQVGLFEEGRFADRKGNFYEWCSMFNIDPSDWDGKYYNTGVMVVSKEHKDMFSPPPIEYNNYAEQTYLNVSIYQRKIPVFELPYKFNRMTLMDKITGEPRHASYFIHYAGALINLGDTPNKEEFLFQIIKSDIETWKKDSPNFKYKRNVAVMVTGGLGDQVAAEPVARYVASNLYKGDNVIISTHYPELFSHIKEYGATIINHGDLVPNALNTYEMYTLTKFGHPIWTMMSHTMVQATDYAAISALKFQLPLNDRSIKLPDFPESKEKLSKMLGDVWDNPYVVVHPGRGWPSKTFPKDVWQSYIDILHNNNIPVVVVGKHIDEDQGYVDVDCSKVIDLRDKISLPDLVELIRKCKILLTNDSSPVHIAGATDAWIFLIATCKHPDYILPYRNGDIRYKTKNLEVDTMYYDFERRFSTVEKSVINLCTEKRMRECLPSAEKVLQEVLSVFY